MRADLINDLRSGYDNLSYEDYPRELARMMSLCEESAQALEDMQKLNEGLSKALQYVNDDPFRVLSKINVNDHIEKKNGLSYLSWAWAWDTFMQYYPDSYTSIKRPIDTDFPYWTDGNTCWVDVSVTVVWNENERTRSEVFPIMDYKNKSIPADKVTSFDVNTALQRAWTKCIARHGLGFYIYAGQDLPNEEAEKEKEKANTPVTYEQILKIEELYTEAEIDTMLKRMKKPAITNITQAQAEKMIAKRDKSLVNDQSPTF